MSGYSFDTSAFIEGWKTHYSPDVFKGLWDNLATLISQGVVLTVEEVEKELAKQKDDLYRWAKAQNGLFLPMTKEVQLSGKQILAKYQKLVDERAKSGADPWVIGLAKENGLTVVTYEVGGTQAKPKIPFVCKTEKIQCITMLEFIRIQGWKWTR